MRKRPRSQVFENAQMKAGRSVDAGVLASMLLWCLTRQSRGVDGRRGWRRTEAMGTDEGKGRHRKRV